MAELIVRRGGSDPVRCNLFRDPGKRILDAGESFVTRCAAQLPGAGRLQCGGGAWRCRRDDSKVRGDAAGLPGDVVMLPITLGQPERELEVMTICMVRKLGG